MTPIRQKQKVTNQPKMRPDFSLEDNINGIVCGIDEVGRGPLAGPVVAACVYIPEKIRETAWVKELNDSKKLSAKKREVLNTLIQENCICGIDILDIEVIDQINILQATLRSMSNAFNTFQAKCPEPIAHALVDGNKAPKLPCSVATVIKGDSKSVSIAAASIVAKVTRDTLMAELAKDYPQYGWHSNVGYGAKTHIEAIHEHGITPHHRRSFEPVKSLLLKQRA